MKTESRTSRRHVTGAGMRVGGDHPALHAVAVTGTIIVALASFATSVFSQLAVAVWQHTPSTMHFLTPVMVDAPIVVFSVGTIIFKAREQRLPEWICRVLALTMTAICASNNFLHTVNVGGLDDYTDWIGACMNALAPVLVFCCTEVLGALLTRPKAKNTALAKARGLAARYAAENRQLKRERSSRSPRAIEQPAEPMTAAVTA